MANRSDTDYVSWRDAADNLEALVAGPTPEQTALAAKLGVDLDPLTPAPVAAVVLRSSLARELREPTPRTDAHVPESLNELEDELGVMRTERLLVGSWNEVSAWFATRYMFKTLEGLRTLEPARGDVVELIGMEDERRVISSIGIDGRVYLKGRPARRAWPNNLKLVARVGDRRYGAVAKQIDSRLRNIGSYSAPNEATLRELAPFKVANRIPPPESIRRLEDLLDSGERSEERFQKLVTEYPALLAPLVLGHSGLFVIPKAKLGNQHVTDFLVMGLSSMGARWVLVELESPAHPLRIKDESHSAPVRHAIKQVQDWREWLTINIAYAQTQLHLHGLTNRAPGLVVIGRAEPVAERDAARAQTDEGQRIEVRSWDWLLAAAQDLAESPIHVSEFAYAGLRSGESAELAQDRLLVRDILDMLGEPDD